jgi:predicted dehydrogenase
MKQKNFSRSRRHFIQGSAAAAGAALGFPAIVSSQSPNSKLHIAVIGAGGRGGSNLKGCEGEDIVALCDVNKNNLSKAHSKHSDARTFIDFREMYSSLSDYDAVVVSTTEHTHAFATLPALKAGKHVYCE